MQCPYPVEEIEQGMKEYNFAIPHGDFQSIQVYIDIHVSDILVLY